MATRKVGVIPRHIKCLEISGGQQQRVAIARALASSQVIALTNHNYT